MFCFFIGMFHPTTRKVVNIQPAEEREENFPQKCTSCCSIFQPNTTKLRASKCYIHILYYRIPAGAERLRGPLRVQMLGLLFCTCVCTL